MNRNPVTILLSLLPHYKPNLSTPVAVVALALATFACASLVSLVGRRIPRVGAWLLG